MTTSAKLSAGALFPDIAVPGVHQPEIAPARMQGWRMVVVYRGRHCPLCKRYLKTLDGLLEDFARAGVSVVAISSDPQDKADADVQEHGWRFPVGYDLTVPQMRQLGLYVSSPRSAQETDRPFPEPGLFVINPSGQAQIIDVSNAPFARPDLSGILAGIQLIQSRDYPIRGTLA
jgi:peroxiredoxin